MSIRPAPPERSLTEMSRARLRETLAALGEPKYRADQLHKWIFARGVRDFEAMTDVPRALRQRLQDEGYTVGRVYVERVRESVDGTRKVQFRLSDGAAIEMRDGDDEDLERAAANLGINLSRNESASVEDLA